MSEGADADGAVAPPTSSYQWILRYVSRHPDHLVFLSRKSESGRSFYGTITRASAPLIPPAPSLVAFGTRGGGWAAPEALVEVAPIQQPPPLAAPAALMEDGHAADGHGQSLTTHRTPAPMQDEDDVFIDDGDDGDDESKSPAPQTDERCGHGRTPGPRQNCGRIHDGCPPHEPAQWADRRGSPPPSSPGRGRRFGHGQVTDNRRLPSSRRWSDSIGDRARRRWHTDT